VLSAAIEKIQTLFSRHFILSSFYPVLIFAFVNLVLLYQTSPRFRRSVATHGLLTDVPTLLQGAVAVVALAMAAFVLSTVSHFLREVIEGNHWPEAVRRHFIPIQRRRFEDVSDAIDDASLVSFRLGRNLKSLREDLRTARMTGSKAHAGHCAYPHSLPAVDELKERRKRGDVITYEHVLAAKKALVDALQANDADAMGAAEEDATRLDRDDVTMDVILAYAKRRAETETFQLFARRRLEFGDGPALPTAAGNMARAVAAYATSRYGFSIDLLWSRLQAVMPKEAYSTLQDAKAELDSLIALWWLALGTIVVWWFVSALAGALMTFVIVALIGPLFCAVLSFLVLESYRGFHDLLRSAVDLYRFELIKALHLPLPDGPVAERALWSSIAEQAEHGRELAAHYEHP
jgi:hypothetical protein